MAEEFVKEITPRAEDYSQWYVDCVLKAELADYAPVRGCMVIRPYGFAVWEKIQAILDRRFKETGHENAYFPLFIPRGFLERESEHVEGFAPELAWVTRGGGEELAEPLAVRPTSETMICSMYAKRIHSYRDLPVLINQWCNVVRWEKATRPFLRTTEFLWQEGHTAHAREEEAREEALRMLEIYRDFLEEDLGIPVIAGEKTPSEKFAGAAHSYSVEALMGDGRALQAGTSHDLGQNFSRPFDISFLDRDGQLKHVWQSSWGVSTRLIGALIMVHGDDRGLVLPPRIAPVPAVLVPIAPERAREAVLGRARQLAAALEGVHLDDRDEYTPGWKYNDWEMRGVPLRIELGPRDLEQGKAVLVRRDTGEKVPVDQEALPRAMAQMSSAVQAGIKERARNFLQERTWPVDNLDQLRFRLEERRGMFIAGWCGDDACEAAVKEATGATARNIPFAPAARSAACVVCGKAAAHTVYYARAY